MSDETTAATSTPAASCGAGNAGELPASFVREQILIQLLMAYIATGVFFMLLPGTFLGVWNLFAISGGHSPTAVSASWIQAHGHAQLFGWIGTFILGIGFYSIPNLRKVTSFGFTEGWIAWGSWSAGVLIRWLVNAYQWQWRALLPVSALLEVVAVVIFFWASWRGHKAAPASAKGLEPWATLIIAGSAGLLLSVIFNLVECLILSMHGADPAFPTGVDLRFLFLSTWGLAVPIAWGLTARWMPPLLALQPLSARQLSYGLIATCFAVFSALIGAAIPAAVLALAATLIVPYALRLFHPTTGAAKTTGVHPAFPIFMRIPYVWLVIAALLQLWACFVDNASGIGGAARHALTVGFLAMLVFTVGPRMLPAFMGRKKLFSPNLMFAAQSVLLVGCSIRVLFEVLAYQHYITWAWSALPVSATLELLAVTLFGINMIGTIRQPALMAAMDAARSVKIRKPSVSG